MSNPADRAFSLDEFSSAQGHLLRIDSMLRVLFLGMLKRTCATYGDCLMHDIGLSPIVLASIDTLTEDQNGSPDHSKVGEGV